MLQKNKQLLMAPTPETTPIVLNLSNSMWSRQTKAHELQSPGSGCKDAVKIKR